MDESSENLEKQHSNSLNSSRSSDMNNEASSPLSSRDRRKTALERDFSLGDVLLQSFLDPKNNIEPGVTAEMWSNPAKEGKLTKQGHVVKTWKSRWFILQENKLFYFKEKPKTDNPEPPLGVILLGFCTIEVTGTNSKSKEANYQFKILQSDWNEGKDFLIQASSKSDMEDWVRALRQAKVFHTKECYTLLDTPEVVVDAPKKVESAAESKLLFFHFRIEKLHLDKQTFQKLI